MTIGAPIRDVPFKRPEWLPLPGRSHWFVSTDGKNRWCAPPLTEAKARK